MNYLKKFTILLLTVCLLAFAAFPALATDGGIKAGIVSVGYGRLNVRSDASASSAVVATLPNDSLVTLISKDGSWWYVEYADGKFGYCHADYIKIFSDSVYAVELDRGTLNVRSGAGTNHSRTDSLTDGETVIVLSVHGDWVRVLYDGARCGFVSKEYIKKVTNAGYTYTPVDLSVPDYKQTDARWSWVHIGSQGGTIGTIGCVTTGIAMMESYRTGETVTPDIMASRLRYTAGGDVYWPSNLVVTTSQANYLERIYELLKDGKPVLIGAKTRYGGQHWVVVTGYTGGGTLSAADFEINDPATHDRTRLSEFFMKYPIFYKYFYQK